MIILKYTYKIMGMQKVPSMYASTECLCRHEKKQVWKVVVCPLKSQIFCRGPLLEIIQQRREENTNVTMQLFKHIPDRLMGQWDKNLGSQ